MGSMQARMLARFTAPDTDVSLCHGHLQDLLQTVPVWALWLK